VCHYTAGFRERTTELTLHYTDNRRAHVGAVVGLYKLNPVDPERLKPPGFNP
jgi:hypothetical protein